MTGSRPLKLVGVAAAGLLASAPRAAGEAPACPLDGDNAAWTAQALDAWELVRDTRLRLPAAAPPEIVLFDAACAYRLSGSDATPDGYRALAATLRTRAGPMRAWSAPHAGEIRLPDGQTVPARPTAFAAPRDGGGAFFVMALPSLWTTVLPEPNRPALLGAVLVHEISHIRQVTALGRRLDALTARGVLARNADDDVVQTRFGRDRAFSAAVTREIDLLYQAAAAPDPKVGRRLAAQALASVDRRRARAFVGADAGYGEVEDVFLTFEGAGNWAGFAWLSDPGGAGLSREAAIDLMRGGRKWWSQELGLALFLTLDRLDPDWPDKVYGEQSALATDLLREALARGG